MTTSNNYGLLDHTKTQMMEPWKEGFCRAAASIAAIVAMLAVFIFIYNLSQGEPIVPLPALALAGIVWLTGLGCRFVLGAHEAERGHKMKQFPVPDPATLALVTWGGCQ